MAEAAPKRRHGRWGKLRSVRVRTTAIAVLVVGAALVIGGITLVVLLRSALTDQVRTAAELRARDVAGALESGTPPARLTVDDDDELAFQVVDDSGNVVASSEDVSGERALADLEPDESAEVSDDSIDEDHPFLLVAAEAETPSGSFTVLVGRSTELVADSTSLVVGVLAGGLPLLLILVGLTTWFIVGRTLAPVDAIRSEVDEISARELHRRVPRTGDDEIGRLAGTMNRMLDRLEHSTTQQRRFVSDASHELRSPVATIRHHAEVALAHPTGTSTEELAEVVLAEDLRVQGLVEDLLLLARADERTLRVNRQVVDVDDLVFEEAERMRSQLGRRVDVSAVSAGRVTGDQAQLSRVVRNLADNASRHATSLVSFTLGRVGDQIVFSVADDGSGVPPEERQRVFERFVRLDEARARDQGGSGLGLAIVGEIVLAHGGTVQVNDAEAGGARFEICLPADLDEP